MKERPAIFKGEMVRQIIGGRKTRTRRVVKPQPISVEECRSVTGSGYHLFTDDRSPSQWRIAGPCGVVLERSGIKNMYSWKCPYGAPGDRLWVRERQRVIETNQTPKGVGNPLCIRVRYEANDEESGWIQYPERLKGIPIPDKCLAYGGYRESSRLTLEVKAACVERVNEITEDDAKAEGVDGGCSNCGNSSRLSPCGCSTPTPLYVDAFIYLWDSINAKPKPIFKGGKIVSYVSYPWAGEPETRIHRGLPWVIFPNPLVWDVEFSNISAEE